MGFWYAYADTDGTLLSGSETELMPKPTRVVYPTEPLAQYLETSGGNVIQQQPNLDSRRRAWEWVGYPGWWVNYQALWSKLEPLRSRYRAAAGLNPHVYLKEDESQELCLITPVDADTVTRTFPYWKVRVLGVSRTLRDDGGLVRYEVTRLDFIIVDSAWNYLG